MDAISEPEFFLQLIPIDVLSNILQLVSDEAAYNVAQLIPEEVLLVEKKQMYWKNKVEKNLIGFNGHLDLNLAKDWYMVYNELEDQDSSENSSEDSSEDLLQKQIKRKPVNVAIRSGEVNLLKYFLSLRNRRPAFNSIDSDVKYAIENGYDDMAKYILDRYRKNSYAVESIGFSALRYSAMPIVKSVLNMLKAETLDKYLTDIVNERDMDVIKAIIKMYDYEEKHVLTIINSLYEKKDLTPNELMLIYNNRLVSNKIKEDIEDRTYNKTILFDKDNIAIMTIYDKPLAELESIIKKGGYLADQVRIAMLSDEFIRNRLEIVYKINIWNLSKGPHYKLLKCVEDDINDCLVKASIKASDKGKQQNFNLVHDLIIAGADLLNEDGVAIRILISKQNPSNQYLTSLQPIIDLLTESFVNDEGVLEAVEKVNIDKQIDKMLNNAFNF